MNEVKDTSIDALKAQLKGVTVLTLSAEVADKDKDLGGHHYVPCTPRACDHAGSSGLKPSPDASNDDDLCEHVALLEKTDEEDAKEEEEEEKEKHEEMTAEAEEENEEKTKEYGEKKSEEEEDKNKKGVEEELVVE
ncbi:histone H3.v1-like [Capsicum annuum]|uniref:histone H3.v1-like n=1 Tax=Capsicum annuum TaxID=4072 RepID=UPI001FB05145|nr:histone H3.v1-like [Capsicum annuum]